MATQSAHSPADLQVPLLDLKHNDDLFDYTRGRFVCDEAYETSQRHVRFDINQLARRAAVAIGAKSCISIGKYPDGMYNKSMLLTMDNGSEVIAKVPNPNAGMPHFTTASEVATMDFARNILGNPVPRVLAWSSRAQENPVGAEYIIMEKAPGIELERVWPSMNIKDRFTVTKAIAGFQKTWASTSFKKYGSLYYAKDLDNQTTNQALYVDANGMDITNEKFAIGPSTGREFIDNGRFTVNFDRGPWQSLEEYHTAIGNREIACAKQLPDLPKARKLKALHCYLELIKFLLPKDPSISSAHLWHGDLHVANIFVNPSEPTEIVSLIDWQSTEISPLYFHARQPHVLDYAGPPVVGLERRKLPKDIDNLNAEEKSHVEALYLQQPLCSLYNTLIHSQTPQIYAALEFQQTTSYLLLLLARNLLVDGEVSYLLQVAELQQTWDELPGAKGSAYPFSFSAKEREDMEADVDSVTRGMEVMCSIRENLGDLFPEQGIVRPDQYEDSIAALSRMKMEVIREFARSEQEREAWEKSWPFGS